MTYGRKILGAAECLTWALNQDTGKHELWCERYQEPVSSLKRCRAKENLELNDNEDYSNITVSE